MYIDKEKCIKCGLCIPYCPMRCIKRTDEGVVINEDECVECEVCRNAKVCKKDALQMRELEWPRTLRSQFSNPLIPHPGTGVPGRGTEEMKTNDVTGRFRRGQAGIAIEWADPAPAPDSGMLKRSPWQWPPLWTLLSPTTLSLR